MAISGNLTKQDILAAIQYIAEKGVPDKNKSTKYELVLTSGKRYSPKYVIAVADHLVNHVDISTEGFNAVEAINFFKEARF